MIAAIQSNSSRSNSVFYVPFYVVGDPDVRQARVTKAINKVEKFEHQYKATCNVTTPSATNTSVFYYYADDGINLASITTAEMTGWQCQEDGSVHNGSQITNITGDVTLVPVYASGAGPISAGVIKTDLFTGTIPASDGSPVDYSASYTGGNCYITIPPLPAGTVLYTDNGNDVTVSSYRVNVTIDGNTLSLPFVPNSTESRVIENIPQGASFTATAIIGVSGGNGYTELLTETASSTVQAGGNITLYTKYPYTCGIANAFSQATINGSTTGYYSNNGNPTTINVTPSASYTSGGQTWYFAGWATSPTATNPDIVGNIIPANTYQGALNLYAVYSSCSVSIASSDSTGTNVIAENSMVSSLTLNAEPAGDFQTTPTYSWNIESPSSNPPVSLSSVSGPSITVTPFTGRTGTATIKVTASDGVHTASSTINVTVAGLSLNTTGPIVLAKGGTANIQAEVIGGYSGGIDYSWNPPSNTLFSYSATSGSSNTITANAGGKTTITVGAEITDNGLNLMLSKTIDVYVLDLQLSGSDLNQDGNGYSLITTMDNTSGTAISANLIGSGMPSTTFSWTLGTADNSSTYIELQGSNNISRTIKPKAAGTGTVTVSTSYGGVTVSKTINVSVAGISLPASPIVLTKGGSGQSITPTMTGYSGPAVSWSWNLDDDTVATISTSGNGNTGTITPVAGGKRTLTVSTNVNGLPLSKTIDIYVLDLQLSGTGVVNSTTANIDYDLIMKASDSTGVGLTANLAGFSSGVTYSWTQPSPYATLSGTTGSNITITPNGTTGTKDFTLTASITGVAGASITKTIKLKAAGFAIIGDDSFVYDETVPDNRVRYYELSPSSGITLTNISFTEVSDTNGVANVVLSGDRGAVTAAKGGTYTIRASATVSGTSITLAEDKTITILRPVIKDGEGSIVPATGNTLLCTYPGTNKSLTGELEGLTPSSVSWSASPSGIISFDSENTANTSFTVNTMGDVAITMTATYNGAQYSNTVYYTFSAREVPLYNFVNNFLSTLAANDAAHPYLLNITYITSSTNLQTIQSALRACPNVYVDLSATQLPSGIDMEDAFYNGTLNNANRLPNLVRAPSFAGTVTGNSLSNAYANCQGLVEAPVIPAGVTNLHAAFQWCSSLTTVPEIPSGVQSMEATFDHGSGSSLSGPEIIRIPSTVTNMFKCFNNCTALQNVNIIIEGTSVSVDSWTKTFQNITAAQNVTVWVPNATVKAAVESAEGNDGVTVRIGSGPS